MTDDELKAIEARASAATAGPWHWLCFERRSGAEESDVLTKESLNVSQRSSRADGVFIAAARSDVPALVAEVRKLRAELEAIELQRRADADHADWVAAEEKKP